MVVVRCMHIARERHLAQRSELSMVADVLFSYNYKGILLLLQGEGECGFDLDFDKTGTLAVAVAEVLVTACVTSCDALHS
jgi:hypothetical protein